MGKVNGPGSQNPGGGRFRRIVTSLLSALALVAAGLLSLPFLPILGTLWFVLPRQSFNNIFAPVFGGISNLWRGASAAFRGVPPQPAEQPHERPAPEVPVDILPEKEPPKPAKPPKQPPEKPAPKAPEDVVPKKEVAVPKLPEQSPEEPLSKEDLQKTAELTLAELKECLTARLSELYLTNTVETLKVRLEKLTEGAKGNPRLGAQLNWVKCELEAKSQKLAEAKAAKTSAGNEDEILGKFLKGIRGASLEDIKALAHEHAKKRHAKYAQAEIPLCGKITELRREVAKFAEDSEKGEEGADEKFVAASNELSAVDYQKSVQFYAEVTSSSLTLKALDVKIAEKESEAGTLETGSVSHTTQLQEVALEKILQFHQQ